MAGYDPLDSEGDPFRPPAVPTLVACLHCGQAYESYRIEWRVEPGADGRPHGFWCCPIKGCDGKGFGFDILPVDRDYQDERGGWVHDGDEDSDIDEDEFFHEDDEPRGKSAGEDGEDAPW